MVYTLRHLFTKRIVYSGDARYNGTGTKDRYQGVPVITTEIHKKGVVAMDAGPANLCFITEIQIHSSRRASA